MNRARESVPGDRDGVTGTSKDNILKIDFHKFPKISIFEIFQSWILLYEINGREDAADRRFSKQWPENLLRAAAGVVDAGLV